MVSSSLHKYEHIHANTSLKQQEIKLCAQIYLPSWTISTLPKIEIQFLSEHKI